MVLTKLVSYPNVHDCQYSKPYDPDERIKKDSENRPTCLPTLNPQLQDGSMVVINSMYNPEFCVLSGGTAGCSSTTSPIPLYLPVEAWTDEQRHRFCKQIDNECQIFVKRTDN